MERVPRIAVIALLLVALPAATAGFPAANVAVGVDNPVDAGPADAGSTDRTAEPAPGDRYSTVTDAGGTESALDERPDADPERSTRQVDENGTPSRLRLDGDDRRTGYVTPSPDLTATLATGDGQVESGYGLHWHVYRVDNADNASHRRELIEDALVHAKQRIQHLQAREAAAIRSYHDGTSSERELVGELARIDAQAETIRRYLEDLKSYAAVDRGLENEIQDAIRGSQLLEGPIRKQIRNGHSGRSEGTLVHVSTTRDGLVLETVTGGQYVREAVRHDHHDPDRLGASDDIRQHMAELYPETFSPQPDEGWSWFPTHEPGLFWVNFVVREGTATLYFDSGTEQVYREQQTLQLSNLPTEEVASSTEGGLTVTVDRADGGNPIVVNISAIGRPVDAVVQIDGERVGRTGEDGQLWTVAPPDEHELTVVGPGRTVNVTVPADSATGEDTGSSGPESTRSGTDAAVSTPGLGPVTATEAVPGKSIR